MSYILDALNKSERERERKQPPGLKNLQGEPLPRRFQLRHFLSLGVLLVVFNSIGVYLYFGAPKDKASDRISSKQAEVATGQLNTVVPPEPTIRTVIQSTSPPMLTPAPMPAPIPAEPDAAISIAELPEDVRNRLPELLITAHIFASDPDLRMVNINGVARHEGDLVNESLQLVEITDLGVVMNFEGYAYAMDIIEDWQNNP